MRISNINTNTYTLQNNPFVLKGARRTAVNFKGFDCSEDSFEIKKLYDVPCPTCGITMLPRKQLNSIVSILENLKGEELIKGLEKYEKYCQDREKRAVDIIKYRALIDKDKNIQELCEDQYNETIKKVKKLQKTGLRKLEEFLKNQKQVNFKQINKIIAQYYAKLEKDDDSYFDERDLFSDLNVLLESRLINQKEFKKVLSAFPNTHDEFRFFVKAQDASCSKIVSNLFYPSMSTCEHVKPKSKNGADNTANYLAECHRCNSKREDKDFEEWIEKFDFWQNFTNYLNLIFKKFKEGELSVEYKDYFDDIVKTVCDESRSKVKIELLDISDKNEIQEQKNEETIPSLQPKDFEEKIQDKNEELQFLKETKQRLIDDEQYNFICQYTALEQKLQNTNNTLSRLYSNLAQKQEDLKPQSEKRKKRIEKNQRKMFRKQVCNCKAKSSESEQRLWKKSKPMLKEIEDTINGVSARKERLLREMNELKPKIIFPQDCRKQIKFIKDNYKNYNATQKQEADETLKSLNVLFEASKQRIKYINIDSSIESLEREIASLDASLKKLNNAKVSDVESADDFANSLDGELAKLNETKERLLQDEQYILICKRSNLEKQRAATHAMLQEELSMLESVEAQITKMEVKKIQYKVLLHQQEHGENSFSETSKNNLKNKIKELEKFIKFSNFEQLEHEKLQRQKRIEELTQEKEEIEKNILFLDSQIVEPQYYEKQIKYLKGKIKYASDKATAYQRIETLKALQKECEERFKYIDIDKQIEELENRIFQMFDVE